MERRTKKIIPFNLDRAVSSRSSERVFEGPVLSHELVRILHEQQLIAAGWGIGVLRPYGRRPVMESAPNLQFPDEINKSRERLLASIEIARNISAGLTDIRIWISDRPRDPNNAC